MFKNVSLISVPLSISVFAEQIKMLLCVINELLKSVIDLYVVHSSHAIDY